MLDRSLKVVYESVSKNHDEFNKSCEQVKKSNGDTAKTLQFLRVFFEISNKINEVLKDEEIQDALKQNKPELLIFVELLKSMYQQAKEVYDHYLDFVQVKSKQNGSTQKFIDQETLNKFLKSLENIQTAFSLFYSAEIYQAALANKSATSLQYTTEKKADAQDKNQSPASPKTVFDPMTHQVKHFPRDCAGKPIDVANMPKRDEPWGEWISNHKATLAVGGIALSGGIYLVWAYGPATLVMTSAKSSAAKLITKLGLMAKTHVATESLVKTTLVTALAATGSKSAESAADSKNESTANSKNKNTETFEDSIRGPYLYF